MRSSALSAAILVASALGVTGAGADDGGDQTREARQLGDEGQRALELRHYQDAADHFRRAEVRDHSPVYLLGLARGLAGLNRVVAAHEMYVQILRDGAAKNAPAAEIKAVDDARKEEAEVATRLAHVTITVTGPEAPYVLLDDVPLAASGLDAKRPLDPGTHVVRATARGYQAATTRFTVAEGGDVAAVLSMSPSEDREADEAPIAAHPVVSQGADSAAPPPPAAGVPAGMVARPLDDEPSPFRIGAYVAFGVGGVGLVLGIVEGLSGSGMKSQLGATCAPRCAQADVDRVQTAFTISTVGYVTAAAGLATGITLLLLQPKAQVRSGPSIAPVVGPGSVGAVGQF